MTTTKSSPNGQERKTLASQIDRLDSILDGLSEALSESVSTAVQEAVSLAVKEAVQTVLTEVLINPELRDRLQPPSPPPPPPPSGDSSPSLGSRIRSQAGSLSSQMQGHCRRWVGKLRQAGSVVRTLLLAGAGIAVATACVARSRVASAAVQLFQMPGRSWNRAWSMLMKQPIQSEQLPRSSGDGSTLMGLLARAGQPHPPIVFCKR
jgi:hypothetical protein